jgi:hypothetical protein
MTNQLYPIQYKGFWIYPLLTGWWEVRIDGQFMKFDSLDYAKSRIDYWTK